MGLDLLRTRFDFETALSATPFALGAWIDFVGPDRILFGSDIPFAPEFIVAESVRGAVGTRSSTTRGGVSDPFFRISAIDITNSAA